VQAGRGETERECGGECEYGELSHWILRFVFVAVE